MDSHETIAIFAANESPPLWGRVRVGAADNSSAGLEFWWCPKMYAASNKSVIDIEKSDGKCFEVIGYLLGETAGFTYRAAYPLV